MSDTPPILYCANHPETPTTLRCNRCEKPICTKCAVLTPTGYRCKECVRGQQKVFNTAQWYDYPLAFIVVGILSFLGILISSVIPFGFLIIFIAPIAGVIISEIARLVIRRRRSKGLFQLTALAAALGCLPILLPRIVIAFSAITTGGLGGAANLLSLLWPAIYTVMVTTTVYYRLSGINL